MKTIGWHPANFEIEWVSVKKFMRWALNYNDLNRFLERLGFLPYKNRGITSLSRCSNGYPSDEDLLYDSPWLKDYLFPLSPISNEIYIKVEMHRGEINVSANYVWELKRMLGLDIHYMSEEKKDVYWEATAMHKTPRWSYPL